MTFSSARHTRWSDKKYRSPNRFWRKLINSPKSKSFFSVSALINCGPYTLILVLYSRVRRKRRIFRVILICLYMLKIAPFSLPSTACKVEYWISLKNYIGLFMILCLGLTFWILKLWRCLMLTYLNITLSDVITNIIHNDSINFWYFQYYASITWMIFLYFTFSDDGIKTFVMAFWLIKLFKKVNSKFYFWAKETFYVIC